MKNTVENKLHTEDLMQDDAFKIDAAVIRERNMERYVQIRRVLLHELLNAELRKKLEAEAGKISAVMPKEDKNIIEVMEEFGKILNDWVGQKK